jgi:hypothetical protein
MGLQLPTQSWTIILDILKNTKQSPSFRVEIFLFLSEFAFSNSILLSWYTYKIFMTRLHNFFTFFLSQLFPRKKKSSPLPPLEKNSGNDPVSPL